MIVDDQESYSTGLADIVQAALEGRRQRRPRVDQPEGHRLLVARRQGPSSTKVVFTPFQLASQTQLLAQQLKSQGKTAVVFATDGSFDSSKYNARGNYVSFFAPDVTTIAADKAIVAAYHKQFPGGTSPFGAPNYVRAQLYAQAVTKACAAGKGTITRASLRSALAKRSSRSRSSARRWRSPPNGDVAGATFHIFKIVRRQVRDRRASSL